MRGGGVLAILDHNSLPACRNVYEKMTSESLPGNRRRHRRDRLAVVIPGNHHQDQPYAAHRPTRRPGSSRSSPTSSSGTSATWPAGSRGPSHSLPKEKFWARPFPFGNSVGHLVLHLTGNLNHYIGAKIGGTGYVRDRPREFTEPAEAPAEQVLEGFHAAVETVVRTIRSLDAEGLVVPVSEEMPIETRFGLLLVFAAHLNNHIGQMS